MSLKAKLEAVIYAAEEPVTRAQLAALFADEAIAWKNEREAAGNDSEGKEAAEEPTERPFAGEHPAGSEVEHGAGDTERAAPEAAGAETPGSETDSSEPARESDAQSSETAADTSVEPLGDAATEAATEETVTTHETATEAEAKRLARAKDRDARAAINELLSELTAEYAAEGRGIEIREIAGGFRMATKAEYHESVRVFVKSQKPPLKLSLPALETLAVIAYRQPVTAPEVNEIRGVDSTAVFGSLLAKKLIATAGRKAVVGRPILYKTTREFLLRFGLKDVSELPSMEEFEKMAASELEEPQAALEEATAESIEFTADMSAEANETASEGETRQPDFGERLERPSSDAIADSPLLGSDTSIGDSADRSDTTATVVKGAE